MKAPIYATFILSLFSIQVQAQGSLDELTEWMTGSFNSAKQAQNDTDYFDINLNMCLVEHGEDYRLLYIEQAVSSNPKKPYRQRVYKVTNPANGKYESEVMKVEAAKEIVGACHLADKMEALKAMTYEPLEGCVIYLKSKGDIYKGSTKGKSCKNAWGKATYATSEVEVTNEVLLSWDRGYDDKANQVWGAEKGGYIFEKINIE